MKPTRLRPKEEGCTPVSSSCVIWQGPDLCCIELCPRDSVSDVIFKISKKLCNLEDSIDISKLDLRCLNLCSPAPCPPPTYLQLLQILIDRICNCCTKGAVIIPPDDRYYPSLSIAQNLRYADANGDPVTELVMDEYVELIGQGVSGILGREVALNETVADQGERITVLEDTPIPEYTPPTVIAEAFMGDDDPHQMNDVLEEASVKFGELVEAAGENSEMIDAVTAQCDGLNTEPRLSGAGTMGAITGWVNSPSNLAQSIKNMWLTICDMRDAVADVIARTATTCASVIIDFLPSISSDGTMLTLFFNGYSFLPEGFANCVADSTITLTDVDGNTYARSVRMEDIIPLEDGYSIDLTASPLVPSANITIRLESCVTNTDITCEKVVIKNFTNTMSVCPAVTLFATGSAVGFTMNPIVKNDVVYSVDLSRGATPDTIIDTITITDPTGPVTDSFMGDWYAADTAFQVRVSTRIGSLAAVSCAAQQVTTPA